jgi:hypothetical protein
MKLLSLKLINFQGGNDAIDFEGKNTNVFGENGTGKTRLASAFSWLLFGKDSLSRTDFEILPLDSSGQRVKSITQAEVEAKLEITTARATTDITLKRIYKEKWGQRGEQRGKLLGHTTEYQIDGVPKSEKDYKAFISQLMPEQQFRLLTSPLYFNDVLSWQERRKVLIDIAGDVSDNDVMSSDAKLAELPTLLQGKKLDDAKAVTEARKKTLRKSLDDVPTRIDEAQRGLPELPNAGIKPKDIEWQRDSLKQTSRSKASERTQLLSGGAIATKTKELREIEGQMLEIKNKHYEGVDGEIRKVRASLNDIRDHAETEKAIIRRNQAQISENGATIKRTGELLGKLKSSWQEVFATEFTCLDMPTACPTCGQSLPADQVEATRKTAQAEFNRQRSEKLEILVKQGEAERKKLDKLIAENKTLDEEIIHGTETVRNCGSEADDIQEEIDDLTKKREDYASSTLYIAHQVKYAVIKGSLEELQAGGSADTSALDSEIKTLDGQIADCEKTLAAIKQREQGLKRIEELKGQEKQWSAELEKLEKALYLMGEFTKAKVTLLADKVNSLFSLAKFKMFDVQVNGQIAECCVTTVDGIPWDAGLNHSAQLRAGLDIISTLSKHYGITAPCFLDNAEAVNEIPKTEGQLICLYVSEDKVMRVEKT